ncbi:hypothetical protein [Pseudomonas laurylsulfatiphila]|uniref:hypothetical protein n=1 Tax=Pseudomonas laurylsulfatiphila TaxID=2011015 RepID=UPI003D20F09D|nr:type IV pilus assembly protein PilQ [Pseudomonas reinekei]MDF9902043.1 type IV pilus assembly protein PilQ [Pseudomonas reinekei]
MFNSLSVRVSFFGFLLLVLSSFTHASPVQPMNLDVDRVDVSAALRLVADFAELNLILADDVKGEVTLHLSRVSWEQALQQIALQKRLTTKIENGTLFVSADAGYFGLNFDGPFSPAEKPTEDYATSIFKVRHVLASVAIKAFPLRSGEHLAADDESSVVVAQLPPNRVSDLKKFLEAVDFPRQQLMIEARIVEVDSNYSKQIGVNWSGTVAPGNVISSSMVDLGVQAATSSASIGYVTNSLILDLELNAMEKSGSGKIISKPRVFAQDRQQATIVRGSEIPYQQSAGDGATSVAFKQAALSLSVLPIVDEEGANLSLELRKDSPDFSNLVGGVPTITTSSISSKIRVPFGQTIAIGGVFSDQVSEIVHEVPGLARIPWLGRLFQFHSNSTTTSELMLFITPTLVPFHQANQKADASRS